jgi:DNA polymerase-3 subunit epsilon
MEIIIILAILAFLYFIFTDNERIEREVKEDYEKKTQNDTKTYRDYRPKVTYQPTYKRKSAAKTTDTYLKNIKSKNIAVIDFETANDDPTSACQVGYVIIKKNKVHKIGSSYIKPKTNDFKYTYKHGITANMVKNELDFHRVWSKIQKEFKGIDFFAAHNAPFDKRVLDNCLDKFKFEKNLIRFICTLQISRIYWKKGIDIDNHQLSTIAKKIKFNLNHHEAESDAIACAKIIQKLSNTKFFSKNKVRLY